MAAAGLLRLQKQLHLRLVGGAVAVLMLIVNWFYYGNARSNKKLPLVEPISSEVALQHPDPTHPVKLGAHSICLSLGVGYQLCSRCKVLAVPCTIALACSG